MSSKAPRIFELPEKEVAEGVEEAPEEVIKPPPEVVDAAEVVGKWCFASILVCLRKKSSDGKKKDRSPAKVHFR
jgi:hypothetical protein